MFRQDVFETEGMFSSARDAVARNVLDSPSLPALKSKADVLPKDLQLLRARWFGLSSTGACVMLQEGGHAPASCKQPGVSSTLCPHCCHSPGGDLPDSSARRLMARQCEVAPAVAPPSFGHPQLIRRPAPAASGMAQALIERGQTLLSTAKVKR